MALAALAEIYRAQGKPDAAIEGYRTVLKLEPRAAAHVVPARDALPRPRARGGGAQDLRGGPEAQPEDGRRLQQPGRPRLRAGRHGRGRAPRPPGARARGGPALEPLQPGAHPRGARRRRPTPRGSTARSSSQFADNGRARFNLAQLAAAAGRRGRLPGRAARVHREGARSSGPAFFFLAREELRAGRLDAAAELARKGLEVDKGSPVAPLGHYVLADVYNRQGKRGGGGGRGGEGAADRVRAAPRPGGGRLRVRG